VTHPGGWRRTSTDPVIAGYQSQIDIAQRIIKRCILGRLDIAAELIRREMDEPHRAFGLALALAEEAIKAAATSREAAAARGATWEPKLLDRTTGTHVTPADNADTPASIAVLMLDAVHRYTSGDQEATKAFTEVYERALLYGDRNTQVGFYQALTDYAVVAQRGDLELGHHT